MKINNRGITLIELLIGIVVAAMIFVVASNFVAGIFGISTKQKRLEILEQTKNDVHSDITTNIKWATDSISYTNGVLMADDATYELINGILYKNTDPLTPDGIHVKSFIVKKHSSSTIPVSFESGFGLLGEYYNDTSLSDSVLTRIDANINNDWGLLSPDVNVVADNFSVRWIGQIETRSRPGQYDFYVKSDDGIRLYVDDEIVIDGWVPGPGNRQGRIDLEGNRRYNIVLEYFDESGGADVSLSWRSPGSSQEIIPSSFLYPTPLSASLEIIIEFSHVASPDIQTVLKIVLSPRRGGVIGVVEIPSATPTPVIPTSNLTPTGVSETPLPTNVVVSPAPAFVSPRPTNLPTPTRIPEPTPKPKP